MPSAVMKRVNVICRCKAVKVLPNNKHKTEKEAGEEGGYAAVLRK